MATHDDQKVRSLIDRWLGRVEAHLADRQTGEREDLLRDLEAHIHDALASRSGEISAGDVEDVLAEMDDPSSYGAPLPKPATRTAPPPPPPTGSIPSPLPYWIALGVALLGIIVPILASAGGGDDSYVFSRTEKLGLFTLYALLLLASIIAVATWWRRMDGGSPDATPRRLAALSFLLLVASLVAPLIGYGVGELLHVSSYSVGRNFEEIYQANRTAKNLFFLFVFTGIAAAVLSYLIGRVALWPRSEDGPILSGWARAQAAVAPILVSLGLLLGLPISAAAFAGVFTQETLEFRQVDAGGIVAMIGVVIGGASLCLLIQALVLRFAPAVVRFVYFPLADGLEQRHARRPLVLAVVATLLSAACILQQAI